MCQLSLNIKKLIHYLILYNIYICIFVYNGNMDMERPIKKYLEVLIYLKVSYESKIFLDIPTYIFLHY